MTREIHRGANRGAHAKYLSYIRLRKRRRGSALAAALSKQREISSPFNVSGLHFAAEPRDLVAALSPYGWPLQLWDRFTHAIRSNETLHAIARRLARRPHNAEPAAS
jgi:hypothetical protein